MGFRLHPYCAKFCVVALLVNRLVADVRYSGDDIWLINGNNEVTTFVRHTTAKQRAVSRVENGNISIRHGLALFVDDGTRQMAISLVGTFYINLMFSTLDHTDWIEANNLQDGVMNSLVLYMSGYAEVFEFIVDKGVVTRKSSSSS